VGQGRTQDASKKSCRGLSKKKGVNKGPAVALCQLAAEESTGKQYFPETYADEAQKEVKIGHKTTQWQRARVSKQGSPGEEENRPEPGGGGN